MSVRARLRRINSLAVVLFPLAICGCEQAPAGFPSHTTPTPISQPFAIDVAPRAMFGGGSGVGTVTLSAPAPSGGLQVALSSNHQAVAVPQTIVVPAGAFSAEFTFTTQTVPADVTVSLQASAAGRSTTNAIAVWAVLPQFFSWSSEPTTFPPSQIGRRTNANAQFTASCFGSNVTISARDGNSSWGAGFGAPLGQPLRVGVYENAESNLIVRTGPGLTVGVDVSPPCSTSPTGRFVVHEVEIRGGGVVNRFWASFEYRCNGSTFLRGDVRVTNPVSDAAFGQLCYP